MLLGYDNLKHIYSYSCFAPSNSLGAELFGRAVQFFRENLYRMCTDWLAIYDEFTVLTKADYVEVYEKVEPEKFILLPILELDEMVFHRTGAELYHVIGERGIQEGTKF